MKNKKLLLKTSFNCFLFILAYSFSMGQSWDWGTAGYGRGLKNESECSSVASDMTGNVYATGYYSQEILFGTDTLITNSFSFDFYTGFLVKYDPNGNLLWATQPRDTLTSSYIYSVTTDESGNSIITGAFAGRVIFGNYILSPAYSRQPTFFIVKYAPNGTVLWAKQSNLSGVNSSSEGYSVKADKNNNIYVGGIFSDTMQLGNYTLIASGQSTPFLAKYDANGNVLWAETTSSLYNGYLSTIAVTADNTGNAYLTGSFTGTITFGANRLVSLNTSSAFLVKYSGSGNVLWAKQSKNVTILLSTASANSIVTDRSNNVYITGSFLDSIKFGSHILYSPYYNNSSYTSAFLTKYDTNGNIIWAQQSSFGLDGNSLTSDSSSYEIFLGATNDVTDTTFTFGNYTLHTSSSTTNNGFLWKFDTNGTAVCGSTLENAGEENKVSICCTSASGLNYIYMGGTFQYTDTVICGPDVLFSDVSGYSNIFVSRWNNCAADAGISEVKDESIEVKVYPNPSNGIFTLVIASEAKQSQSTIEVYNMLGEKVYSQFNIQHPTFNIDLSDQPNGVYLYRVTNQTGELVGEGKLVIER